MPSKHIFVESIHGSKTLGDQFADIVATIVGSWRFIIIQSCIIFVWVLVNATGSEEVGFLGIPKWDSYPFIFLNLMLSFQAAYTAPIIMMSQNRQSSIDRARSEADFEVNRIAEAEIELIQKQLKTLHNKIDKTSEVQKTLDLIREEIVLLRSAYTKESTSHPRD